MLMQKLRNKHIMKGTMWVIIIVVVPSFVAFYGFSAKDRNRGVSPTDALVTVTTPDGEKHDFDRDGLFLAKRSLVGYYANLYQMLAQSDVGQEQRDSFERILPNQDVAEYAAVRVALEQRTKEQEIFVGAKQVEQLLVQQGVTATQLDAILKANRMSQHQFLMQQRTELTQQRSLDSVQRMARTSLLEMWQEYRRAKETMTASVLNVPSAQFAEQVTITDADLETELARLAKDAPTTVRKSAERTYSFVRVDGPPIDPPTAPSDEELQKILDAKLPTDLEFIAGSGARVRHVLVSIDMNTTDTMALAAARESAVAARARILAGEDFGVVADEVTLDNRNLEFGERTTSPTLRGGTIPRPVGDTDIDRAAWGDAFVQFATTAEPGAVSDVIETLQGFSVAKVVERGENLKRTLPEVRDSLTMVISNDRSKAAATKRKTQIAELVEKVRTVAGTQSSLEGIARELGVEVKKTSSMAADLRFIPGVGNLSRDAAILDDLRKGEISSVLDTSAGDVIVLQVAEEIPGRLQTLDEARALLSDNVRMRGAMEMARKRAEELRAELKADDRLTSFGLEKSLTVAEVTVPFTREAVPVELNMLENFAGASLSMKPMQTMVRKSVGGPDVEGYSIVQVVDIKAPDKAVFLAEVQNIESSLFAAKRQGALEDFFQDARSSAKVETSEMFIPKDEKKPGSAG